MINVGDRVKCVDASGTNDNQLIEGREYIVYGERLGCCVSQLIDIGHRCLYVNNICHNCLTIHGRIGQPRVYNSTRFAKVEEAKEYRVIEVATVITEERKDLVLN